METATNVLPGDIPSFRGLALPEVAQPVGYAALIAAFNLAVPLPRTLTAISQRHRTYVADRWRILTPRSRPAPDVSAHLLFALRNEPLDLIVLKRLFQALGPGPIEAIVNAAPTGAHPRRLWFLYEWLLGVQLDLPDAPACGPRGAPGSLLSSVG